MLFTKFGYFSLSLFLEKNCHKTYHGPFLFRHSTVKVLPVSINVLVLQKVSFFLIHTMILWTRPTELLEFNCDFYMTNLALTPVDCFIEEIIDKKKL